MPGRPTASARPFIFLSVVQLAFAHWKIWRNSLNHNLPLIFFSLCACVCLSVESLGAAICCGNLEFRPIITKCSNYSRYFYIELSTLFQKVQMPGLGLTQLIHFSQGADKLGSNLWQKALFSPKSVRKAQVATNNSLDFIPHFQKEPKIDR